MGASFGSGRLAQSDVRNAASSPSARQLHIDVDGRAHVVEDVLAPETGSALQHKEGDLLDGAIGAVGVNRRHGPRMTRADGPQEGVGLRSAEFPQDDPVRSHPQ